jgi:hypothetical protein
VSRWMADAAMLEKTLPESVQNVIAKHESDGSFDSPDYQSAVA